MHVNLRAALAPIRLCAYARLRSTQQKAIQEFERGRLTPPAVVVAALQTAGCGRRDNRWWSDEGTLCATFVLPAQAPASNGINSSPAAIRDEEQASYPSGQLPLRAGIAVAEVVEKWLPKATVQVKWPNDVLVNGQKIAGILCERRRGCDFIGIGLNVTTNIRRLPPDVRRRATSLRRHSRQTPSRQQALIEIARALLRCITRMDFQEAYQQRCVFNGRAIRVGTEDRWILGECRGIDEEGRLLVETPSGLMRLVDNAHIDW
jgi:BirA family biotin operon repressor/biotin-[acetyl-CoA-carboxylase] ligase